MEPIRDVGSSNQNAERDQIFLDQTYALPTTYTITTAMSRLCVFLLFAVCFATTHATTNITETFSELLLPTLNTLSGFVIDSTNHVAYATFGETG